MESWDFITRSMKYFLHFLVSQSTWSFVWFLPSHISVYLLMLTYNKQFIWEYSINLQCFSWFPPLCAWGFRWQLCRWFKRTRSSRIRSFIWGLTVKRKKSEPFFILSFETFCSCLEFMTLLEVISKIAINWATFFYKINLNLFSFCFFLQVRALVEGQLLSMRAHAERFGMPTPPTRMIATGGASANQAILKIIASIFGSNVYVVERPGKLLAPLRFCFWCLFVYTIFKKNWSFSIQTRHHWVQQWGLLMVGCARRRVVSCQSLPCTWTSWTNHPWTVSLLWVLETSNSSPSMLCWWRKG